MSKQRAKDEPTEAEPSAAAPAVEAIEPAEPAPWLTWMETRLADPRAPVALVLAMGFLLFFPYLGALGIWDCWEPHYGEVAREMIVRNDYVYPHWESAYFFSKPVLPLWLMAIGMIVVGAETPAPTEPLGAYTEWGIRVPFALIAIFCMWAVYRVARQLRGKEAGVLAAVVLGSSSQFIFIGKQAMADMPLVGFMTGALAFFVAAVFGEEAEAKSPAPGSMRLTAVAGIVVTVLVQVAVVALGIQPSRQEQYGPLIAALSVTAAIGVIYSVYIALKGTRRDTYLTGFYLCMGLAALSKGLAPLAVVGPLVIIYILLTFDFRILLRARVIEGGLLFLAVSTPWYLTLSLFTGRDDEGKNFVGRFWLHDNLNRVGRGVHGDKGGLGYFMEQLAYGMFPWIAVVPYALGLAAKNQAEAKTVDGRRATLFVLLWALWAYVFFTVTQTKFHHYIFPAVPPLSIVVGLWLHWVAKSPSTRLKGYIVLPAAALFAVAARDLVNDPQHLVNLFTYKYDRDYPREINPRAFIATLSILGGAAMIGAYLLKRKGAVLGLFVATGILFGTWISHYHFNELTPHWSQAHLFKTYFAERTGDEPIYAYQLNWRGETFYSRNRILQVKEAGANQRIKTLIDRPGREFIITEQSRYHTLKGVLSADKRDKVQIIDRSNNKFYLVMVED